LIRRSSVDVGERLVRGEEEDFFDVGLFSSVSLLALNRYEVKEEERQTESVRNMTRLDMKKRERVQYKCLLRE